MKHPKPAALFTLFCAIGLGALSLVFQGCASSSGPTSPLQATTLAATPTPVPNNVIFSVANSAGNLTVQQIAVTSNSTGLTDYAYCSVAGGSTSPVTVVLPSGSGSYQVTINCDAAGYCRKAVLTPVNLAVGTSTN
ncbi:MAG TPA: hypothetical protein VGR89_15375, partial [Puia sp.]|nr:hypothetical protein [Puia sp.]